MINRANPRLPEPGNDFTLEDSVPNYFPVDPRGTPKPDIKPQ